MFQEIYGKEGSKEHNFDFSCIVDSGNVILNIPEKT